MTAPPPGKHAVQAQPRFHARSPIGGGIVSAARLPPAPPSNHLLEKPQAPPARNLPPDRSGQVYRTAAEAPRREMPHPHRPAPNAPPTGIPEGGSAASGPSERRNPAKNLLFSEYRPSSSGRTHSPNDPEHPYGRSAPEAARTEYRTTVSSGTRKRPDGEILIFYSFFLCRIRKIYYFCIVNRSEAYSAGRSARILR